MQVSPCRSGTDEALYQLIRHGIFICKCRIIKRAAVERDAVIEQRSKPDGLSIPVDQDFDVCSMSVTVQDQVIHEKHLVNILCPAVADAELKRRFIGQLMTVIVSIQSLFLLSAFSEIEGCADPCADRLLIYNDICMNELVRKMRNVK